MVSLQVQLQTQSVASANWQTPHAMHMHAVLFDYRTVRYILIGCPATATQTLQQWMQLSEQRKASRGLHAWQLSKNWNWKRRCTTVCRQWVTWLRHGHTQKTWQHSISPALSLKSIHAQMFHDKWQSHEPHAVMQPARTVWMNALGSVC